MSRHAVLVKVTAGAEHAIAGQDNGRRIQGSEWEPGDREPSRVRGLQGRLRAPRRPWGRQ
jgi:hypothetical protein